MASERIDTDAIMPDTYRLGLHLGGREPRLCLYALDGTYPRYSLSLFFFLKRLEEEEDVCVCVAFVLFSFVWVFPFDILYFVPFRCKIICSFIHPHLPIRVSRPHTHTDGSYPLFLYPSLSCTLMRFNVALMVMTDPDCFVFFLYPHSR